MSQFQIFAAEGGDDAEQKISFQMRREIVKSQHDGDYIPSFYGAKSKTFIYGSQILAMGAVVTGSIFLINHYPILYSIPNFFLDSNFQEPPHNFFKLVWHANVSFGGAMFANVGARIGALKVANACHVYLSRLRNQTP